LLKLAFAVSRTNCFSKIIREKKFVVIIEFRRLSENLNNGSIDFSKTLNIRAWWYEQFYYWALLTLIYWNTFRFNVKEDIWTDGKASLQIHRWQVNANNSKLCVIHCFVIFIWFLCSLLRCSLQRKVKLTDERIAHYFEYISIYLPTVTCNASFSFGSYLLFPAHGNAATYSCIEVKVNRPPKLLLVLLNS